MATPSWLDLRLVLGVLLVLGSVLVGAVVVSRAGDTDGMVVATHDLAAGTVLRDEDLEVRQVQVPDGGHPVYLSAVGKAIGRTLTRSVSKDELLPVGAVSEQAAGTRVTIPFASGNAPELRTGQRIQVWVSTSRCASVILLPDVTVQSVRSGGGSFDNGSGGQNVVVTVRPAQADRVIAALGIEDAQIRAGVLVGPKRDTPSASSTPAPAASPGALPDDLAGCVESTSAR